MRVLTVHNAYQLTGGEDVVFEAEARLLSGHGHDVTTFRESNDRIQTGSALQSLGLATQTIWSQNSYRKIAEVIEHSRPDIAHFHNTFPLISPSVYHACRNAGVPVVQTLHNYRLFCPNASF